MIWAVHTTGCNINSTALACVRAVRLSVGQDASGNPTATMSQQTVFGSIGTFLFEPGVAVNRDESVAIPFQVAGLGTPLGAFWTEKDRSSGRFFSMLGLAQGQCSQTTSGRTGRYTGAQTDPATQRLFYMAAEAAAFDATKPPVCRIPTTRVIVVDPGVPVTTPP